VDSRIATIAYNVNKKSPKVCVFAEVKDVYFPTANQRGSTPMLYYRSMIEDFYACKYSDDGYSDDEEVIVMMVRTMWRMTIVMMMLNDDGIDDIARYG